MKRCYVAFNNEVDALKAYGNVKSQLCENGELIDAKLVIFAADNVNFNFYSRRLSGAFPNATVIGTTSKTFFTGTVSAQMGIVVIAITEGVTVSAGLITEVARFPKRYISSITEAYEKFETNENLICLEFNASKDKCEELVMDTFKEAIGDDDIPICGCTASIGELTPAPAYVSLNGITYTEGCVFAFIRNDYGKIDIYKENMFKPTGHFFYATDVDCDERIVYEFDHKPAAEAIGDVLSMTAEEFSKQLFFYPMGRMENGDLSIVSERELLENGAIAFYAKMFSQVRMELLEPMESLDDVWKDTSVNIKKSIKKPSITFIINCSERTNFFTERGIFDDFLNHLDSNYENYIGVSAEGEQMDYKHLNQTMLAIVFE